MKKHDFSYFFREGVGNMFSHGFMSFAAIGITVACLLIMGTFSLVAYNANENLKDLQKENAILAFVDETLSEDEARAMGTKLSGVEGVAECTFVSREEAKETYLAEYDDNELYSNLGDDVFRHRYVLHLSQPERMQEIKAAVEQVEGVAWVRADEAISNGFMTARNIAGVVSIALIVILLVISVFITSNTIKLTTFDRRDEIAIMKMVGATDGFIRWPFVYEGLMIGLCGAVVAFLLQWLMYAGIAQGISNSDTLQLLTVAPFQQICVPVAVIFLIVGVLVGIGGSLMAIRKFLRV